ncbi:MAG: amino acid permease [Spirochaetales bacterium]|nr:amino acid permease [Spirochaetales bacterium]
MTGNAAGRTPRVLGAGSLFAIAAGAMISSGIFVLPGIAFSRSGPAMIIAYGIAGIIAFIGTLSIVELATGMPKAGGDYFFIARSLGPLMGTISGLLSWFALSAKSAFAVYGLSALIASLTPLPLVPVSIALVVLFVAANFLGAKSAAKIEIALVAILVTILIALSVAGLPQIDRERFTPFFAGNWNTTVSAIGFVFVSFGGLINASSVSGEVKRPGRAIPLGILGAIVAVTALYVLSLIVTVGVSSADELSRTSTPLADAARNLVGPWGFAVLAVGASLAFITTAHAGILSSARYPFALARDQLLPSVFGRFSRRQFVPYASLLTTGVMVAAGSIVSLELLVTAASTIIMSSYLLANLGVLVMRYSKLTSYRPTFRVRFTPFVQIFSMVLLAFFIIDLGVMGLIVAGSLTVISVGVYLLYGRSRHTGEYALLHLIERITNREIAGDNLERELRDIVHEKDEIELDPVDAVFKEALFIDVPAVRTLEDLFPLAAVPLQRRLNMEPARIEKLLWQRERESSTAIAPFVAVPHLVLENQGVFLLLAVRAPEGVRFNDTYEKVKAIFVLVGSKDKRTLHLQTLAALAQIAMDRRFEPEWLSVRRPEQLREVLLLGERRRIGGSEDAGR